MGKREIKAFHLQDAAGVFAGIAFETPITCTYILTAMGRTTSPPNRNLKQITAVLREIKRGSKPTYNPDCNTYFSSSSSCSHEPFPTSLLALLASVHAIMHHHDQDEPYNPRR
jgi:hypothetical protein